MNNNNNTPLREKKEPRRLQSFLAGFEMLPAKLQPAVREELKTAFGYPDGEAGRVSLWRLINGKKYTDPIQREKIEEIFKPYTINPWTGTSLQKEKGKLSA